MDRTTAQQSQKRWFPYDKGGEYRKWYGNRDYVVDWFNDGYEMQNTMHPDGSRIWAHNFNLEYNFIEHISWNDIVTGTLSFRYFDKGFLFDSSAATAFVSKKYIFALMGYLNTSFVDSLSKLLNPTIHFKLGDYSKLPFGEWDYTHVGEIAKENIDLAKEDWDSFESSWDYIRHPLIAVIPKNRLLFEVGKIYLAECYMCWESECEDRFKKLKKNEEELNRIFISTYGLENELSSEVDDKDITVRRANAQREIKSLISYAVGCMFGRYSLNVEGIAYAGGDWKEAYATKYNSFMPDEDGIIPITDEEYFKDDIVARFVDFIRIVYGGETLEDNLKFIADALGNKGDTPRAVIRNYFLNDFYKDHCNTYSVTGSGKRPIYWLFDAGKQNGFKALIYIHRYTPDTVGLVRSKYLHNAQAAIQNSLQNSEYIIASTTSATERARETKKRDKYVKQLNELRPYYQALTHIALQRIPMDLDDGVKKNYQLFQNVEISTEGKKKQSINLLAKI